MLEERYSAWQKRQVRTIVVNSRSKVASRRSIAGALAAAKPYERIELLGGEYFETLSITIPIEIVAADGEDPCIISRGSSLTVTQNVEAYFEHVEFISKGKGKLEASVVLQGGKTVFFRCKMNSILLGGLARPRFEHCTVTDSFNGYGLQISGNAGADVLSCTIATHHMACVDIDTKGVVTIRDSTLRQPSNGGHVVVLRATNSFIDNRSVNENLACRKVTVTKCHIYVTPEIFKPKEREWPSGEVVGPPVCVIISRGACPVFTSNELLQGYIGFKLDVAGTASLEGNCIYDQKIAGILAIVDDKYYSSESNIQNLSISGGNVIDRCLIGIDVQCSRSDSGFPEGQQNLLSQQLPSPRTSFNWLENLPSIDRGKPNTTQSDKESVIAPIYGKSMDLRQLGGNLRILAKIVCSAHPAYFRGNETGAWNDMPATLNRMGVVLQENLGISEISIHPSDASLQMLKLRGNRGVDILDTRFSSCGLCAVRFGNDGYGLVEDCDFITCGATAIVIGSGAHPLVVGCKFDRSKGSGIFLDNFANPLIIGNEIIGNAEHGIEVRNLSSGIVMGNVILGNSMSGIYLTGGCNSIITGNVIERNQEGGINVRGGSKPVILMNELISNVSAQILVGEYSMPIIASNKFTSGPKVGICFNSCSGGTVFDNTMTNNMQGIVVELDADPYVISNKIFYSTRHGVVVGNNGLGTFLYNEIAQSGSCNFVIREGGSPVVRDNNIHSGHSGGVAVLTEGFGKMEHNVISGNAIGNVIVLDRYSEPVFTGNTISSSASGVGVICGRESGGQFIGNSISQNKQSGIYVIGKSNPQFIKNTVSSETVGAIVSDGSRGTFRENNIHSCHSFGFIIQLNGDPTLQDNRISKCFLSGLLLAAEGLGTVYENEFFENDVGIQLGSTLGIAELEVELNFAVATAAAIPNNETVGSVKSRRPRTHRKGSESRVNCRLGTAEVRQNKIYANSTCGVLIEKDSCGTLEDNDISGNGLYGVMAAAWYSAKRVEEKLGRDSVRNGWKLPRGVSFGGAAIIRKNRIFQHKHSNIAIIDHDENLITIGLNDIYESNTGIYVGNNASINSIEGNSIHDCVDGVYAENGGRGGFTENKVYDCSGVGIYVCSRANPEFHAGNIIEKCNISGVLVDAGGRGTFTGITVRHCAVGVIAYTCPPISSSMHQEAFVQTAFISSAPLFEECIIEDNALHGILVLTVPSGYPLRYTSDDESKPYQQAEGLVKKPGVSLFPRFRQNIIRQNRYFGICHELYESVVPVGGVSHHMALREALLKPRLSNPTSQNFSSSKLYLQQGSTKHLTVKRQSSLPRHNSEDETVGTSVILKLRKDHDERIQRQASFLDNTISNCSIGVVVGSGCHPFLLNNRIQHNSFFGILLRFNSRAMCFGCELTENGLAGIYCVKGSLGTFTSGSIRCNNGFYRPEGNSRDARSFHGLPFTNPADPLPHFTFTASESLSGVYAGVIDLLSQYTEVVSCGLQQLCELLTAPSEVLSLATSVFPPVEFDGYDRGWTVNGGLGAWMVLGSGTELRGNVVEGHRVVGVLVSRGLRHHSRQVGHRQTSPRGGFPSIPTTDPLMMDGRRKREGGGHAMWSLFGKPALVHSHHHKKHLLSEEELQMALSTSFMHGNKNHKTKPPSAIGLEASHEKQSATHLYRPATLLENKISKNEYGVVIQLFNVMQTSALNTFEGQNTMSGQSEGLHSTGDKNALKKRGLKSKKPRNLPSITPDSKPLRPSTVPREKKNTEVTTEHHTSPVPLHKPTYPKPIYIREGEMEYSLIVEENHIFENLSMGILCQHVVEVFCGSSISSKSTLIEAGKDYDDVCVKFTLKREITQPKLFFTLVPQEQRIRHARISGNEIYNNQIKQLEVTSRYVAITGDGLRTLLHIDTLRQPNASMCSSQALLRIPLFASLTMTVPHGVFLLENNCFRDSCKGIHVVGIVGRNSLRLRHNTFLNISETAILIEGHLASASIGNGNIFEENTIAIRIILPEDSITQEEILRQEAIGVTTRIYSNCFCVPKQHSILIEGGGAPSPILIENEFKDHMNGSVAFFIEGPTVRAHLKKNIFKDNYVPVIISNRAGSTEKGGSSVVLEGNRFSRNFIGVLVCGGAAPSLLHNVFEENLRAGLEIIEDETQPIVKRCVFVMNRRSDKNKMESKKFIYPEDGKLQLYGIPYFEVEITSENSVSSDGKGGGSGDNGLPCGILVSSGGRGLVEYCLFRSNEVGVNVTRAFAACMKSSCPEIKFVSCFFIENNVAGVFVRGGGIVTSSTSKTLPRRLSDVESTIEGPLFEKCFFACNANDPENSGDVISIDGGFAVFRENALTGCLHGRKDGRALFLNNTFLSSGVSDVAVFMHKGTRIRLVGNIIREYKTAITTDPGAWGQLEKNWILYNMQGVIAAPFCHTLFSSNRIMSARDCGILAYGGVFTDNEVSLSPTGILVQNPTEYKKYDLIPSIEKTSFDALISENKVHSCENDGIFIAGGARIEGNIVSNCNNNMTVCCPTHAATGASIATISKNIIFDGNVGLLVAKGSDSVIRDNDIFDNATIGVWLKAGSAGVLQGNAISSSLKEGALDMEVGTAVKILHNTIKNQFSPSYRKTLPMHREKERQVAAEALSLELQELERKLAEVKKSCYNIEMNMLSTLESLQEENIALEGIASFSNTLMTGVASTTFSRSVVGATIVELVNVSLTKNLRRLSTDRSSSSSVLKASRSADRRSSQSLPSLSKKSYTRVLIHVFDGGKEGTIENSDAGREVGAVFTSSSLATRGTFRTVVTTNASSLAASITAERPDVVVVVMRTGKHALTPEENSALSTLERLCSVSSFDGRRSSGLFGKKLSCVITLLPHEWKTAVRQGSEENKGLTLQQNFRRMSDIKNSGSTDRFNHFAVSTNPIYYTFNISEALAEMERKLESFFPVSVSVSVNEDKKE